MKKSINFITSLKFIACFSVIAVHFRLNTEHLIPVEYFGFKTRLFMSSIYQVFLICVPLFLLITGFLMYQKTATKQYYLNLLKVVTLYIICALFTYVLQNKFMGVQYSPQEIVKMILSFKLIGYSWYVNMYIGLYLLIPFINKLINHLSKKEFRLLLLTFILVCALPMFVNSNPFLAQFIFLPAYWMATYPLMYYAIGAYIRKYSEEIQIKSVVIVPVYLVATLYGIGLNFIYAKPYVLEVDGSYPSLIVLVQSVAVFLLMKNRKNIKTGRIVLMISKLTLPIYLMSFVVDKKVYPYVFELLGKEKMVLASPFIILTILSASLILAYICNSLNNFSWHVPKLIKKIPLFSTKQQNNL
ncbi:acyltransferase [Isobaculum melis]|uniref:Surface polysaccharide O-acyltransferase, integral membrane enzyme n=1 Tax=Isobaculum melis TaxID=142588 RepID=A0A1H9TH74_9LACT|nr:acyltransferase family protein [Isobaculum melis]SER96478.1 Surface polysaccharide O-acyltransferase, integral membrane enzyme [Isobaculum melis]